MSAGPKPRKLTVAEYLEIERSAEFKSEFFNGEMFPIHPPAGPRMMAGASRVHNVVFRNLFGELYNRVKAGPCQIFAADQRVNVARSGLYTYPDLLIVCGPPEYALADPDSLTNPKVVIEVLSDSTEKYDRTTKFRHYKRMPSVMGYVLVSQDEPLIERYTRSPDGTWAQSDFVGLDAAMALATVPASVALADIYLGVEFPPPQRPSDSVPA